MAWTDWPRFSLLPQITLSHPIITIITIIIPTLFFISLYIVKGVQAVQGCETL